MCSPTPTATEEPAVCECWRNLYNCGDFDMQAEAQAIDDFCMDKSGSTCAGWTAMGTGQRARVCREGWAMARDLPLGSKEVPMDG